jgi:hypothetical protein
MIEVYVQDMVIVKVQIIVNVTMDGPVIIVIHHFVLELKQHRVVFVQEMELVIVWINVVVKMDGLEKNVMFQCVSIEQPMIIECVQEKENV